MDRHASGEYSVNVKFLLVPIYAKLTDSYPQRANGIYVFEFYPLSVERSILPHQQIRFSQHTTLNASFRKLQPPVRNETNVADHKSGGRS